MNHKHGTQKKVSVILSVYNSERFLRQCLDSIIRQTLKDIEIICVDDDSDDNSYQILQEYAAKDNRITVVKQTHGGAGKARNTGLDLAGGEYLSILDSDDFFEPDMLEKAYLAAEQYHAEIVVFRADFFDQHKYNFVPCNYSIKPDMLPQTDTFSADDIADRIFNIGCGWAWDKLFKRDFVEKYHARFQEIRSSNDMFFVFSLYTKAQRIHYLDKLLIHQRINASKSVSVTREKSWDNFYLALTALKADLVKNGTYSRFRHSFVNWALNFSLWHIDTIAPAYKHLLIKKCREKYFHELDVLHNSKNYYINPKEYERLQEIMNGENNIKVSVVIPVYNGEDYLNMCLISVAAQTLRDIQIICVDDGSTDGTPDILREFESKDDRVIVITKEHTNAGDCRNIGLDYADGEYVAFLDSDDFFEPDMLEKAYDSAKEADADINAFRCNQYDENTEDFRNCPWTLKLNEMPEQRPFSNHDCAEHIFTMTSCTAWDKLFKRDFIVKNNIRFQSIPSCNDMLFTFSAYAAAEKINTLDEVLAHQRLGQHKHLAQDIEYLWHNFYDALMALKNFLIERNLYAEFKKSFVNWALDFSLWNMHNYQDHFREMIRQSLKNRFFDELDISTSPEEDFANKDQYSEMQFIMAEKKPFDPNVTPKVSILIPTYNVEQYMRICLDSAVNQTLSEIEIIVINDGSKDNCLQIINEYAARDPRIKVIDKENGGYGMAMNRGYDIATGKYIGIIEPDDFVDLHMFEDLYNIAEENQLDFVKADFNRFMHDDYGNLVLLYNKIAKDDKNYNIVMKPSEYPESFKFIMNTWSGIYNHQFLLDHNIRHHETPGASFQDNGFWFQTMMYAERAMFCDRPYYFNRRDNPNSSVASREKVYCMNEEYTYIRNILKEHPELSPDLMGQLHAKKYRNYLFRYSVIAQEYQEEYIQRMADEFRQAIENNELDEKFFEPTELENLTWIMNDPHDYYEFNNSSTPCVSVIVPVYNTAPFLRQCLDSILSQTLQDIEVICVDDGSEDESVSILREYEQADSRVKVLLQQNSGGGAARNKGIDIAKGKYLSFLDSDDFFEPKMLEEAYKKCERTGAEICVYQVRRYNNETGESFFDKGSFVEANFPSKQSGIEVFSAEDLGSHVFNTFMTWPWNKMFQRKFVMANGLRFQEIMRTNDLYFVNTALLKAKFITTVRIPLVNYRIGTTDNCQATNNKAPTDFHKALCALYEEVKKVQNKENLISFYNLYVRSCNYNMNSLFALDAEAYAFLYRYLHGEGFDILDPTKIPADCITPDNAAAYRECCQFRRRTFESYMVNKLQYNREVVKNDNEKLNKAKADFDKQKKEIDKLKKEIENLKKNKKELDAMKKKMEKLDTLKKLLKEYLA